ncbi:U3 small nucleolar RNA-associated protein 15, putative [Plasmodium chabaudi adami]|uniref:U3 small nucleolar RNA-associated protein 15, putative n=1 Tax=Plasmodium chabaudi adami TaxID=5826 RepID=A0A1C6XYA3_PLACE|nr:U3 small nucleolar RNA-associated protein 15, putative [Plasmodium chabaudi adami]
MSFFQPIELIRKKKTVLQDCKDYLFDFKIVKKENLNSPIKSVSIWREYAAIGCNDTVSLYDIKGKWLQKKYSCKENISFLKFRDDKMLGVGMENGNIELIGIFFFDRIKNLKGHKSSINDMCFSSNFQKLYSCSRDFTIKIWNILEGKCENTLDYHIDSVTSICMHKGNEDNYLISSSYDGYIYFYNLDKNENTNKLELKSPIEYIYIYKDEYICVAVKNVIKIYSLENMNFIKDIIITTKTIYFLNSFNKYIVAASIDASIYFIDPQLKHPEKTKVVSIFSTHQASKCISIYENTICLAENGGIWSIYAYCEGEKKTIKNKRKYSIINLEEEKYRFTNKNINHYIRTFKYNDALIEAINHESRSILSLIDYLSKQNMLLAACSTFCEERVLKILRFFKSKFVLDILMFEFFFSFLSANKWIETSKNKQILNLFKELQYAFGRMIRITDYYKNLKEITDDLKNK